MWQSRLFQKEKKKRQPKPKVGLVAVYGLSWGKQVRNSPFLLFAGNWQGNRSRRRKQEGQGDPGGRHVRARAPEPGGQAAAVPAGLRKT